MRALLSFAVIVAFGTVTAEAAGSSPVVPAILFNYFREWNSISREELIAEMGSAMLCGVAGIEQSTLDNSAAYLRGWISRLRGDSRLVISAASAAQKAADYIRGESGNGSSSNNGG